MQNLVRLSKDLHTEFIQFAIQPKNKKEKVIICKLLSTKSHANQ